MKTQRRNTPLLSRLARLLRGPGSDAGSIAVEFAIAAPILLGLLFGIMEVGRLLFTQSMMYYAAESSTRWAIVNEMEPSETQADYENRIQAYAKTKVMLIGSNSVNFNVKTPGNAVDKTRQINVNASYQFSFMMPFVTAATGPIELSAQSIGFLAEED